MFSVIAYAVDLAEYRAEDPPIPGLIQDAAAPPADDSETRPALQVEAHDDEQFADEPLQPAVEQPAAADDPETRIVLYEPAGEDEIDLEHVTPQEITDSVEAMLSVIADVEHEIEEADEFVLQFFEHVGDVSLQTWPPETLAEDEEWAGEFLSLQPEDAQVSDDPETRIIVLEEALTEESDDRGLENMLAPTDDAPVVTPTAFDWLVRARRRGVR